MNALTAPGAARRAGWDSTTDSFFRRAGRARLPHGTMMAYPVFDNVPIANSARTIMSAQQSSVEMACNDFRHCLEFFYAHLKLAPPYHSVEKAILQFSRLLNALPPEERECATTDHARRWALYRQAVVESGLNQKHRGIVAGLVRNKQTAGLPEEYEHLLGTFLP